MTIDQPLVSIGVPVYNDGPHLRNALERLLDQDYRNLEIILADDGSTDGSREVCREYAQRDARIRLIENKHNLGAYGNHKFVFDVSTGDYFAWGSGHDYFHPAFVSRLLENLQANPSVVMCCPQSVFMDENGKIFRTTKGGLDTRGFPPPDRFEKLLVHLVSGGTANIFYGLYRQESLAQVDVKRQDVIILGELSLLGEMTQINEVLYHRLVNKTELGNERKERHTRVLTGLDGFSVDALMPYVGVLFSYMQVIEESKLPAVDRQFMFQVMREETFRLKAILHNEFAGFVENGQHALQSNHNFPEVQRYYAPLILDGLNKAQMLGIKTWRSNRLRSACNKILGKVRRIKIDPLEKKKVYVLNKFSNLKKYFRRV
jgi:glycosyltransferase involved in cell wall biosynthesis